MSFKKWLLIGALALLVAGIGVAGFFYWQFRSFLETARPAFAFDAEASPAPPDYNDPANWAVTPSAPAKAAMTPEGVSPVENEKTLADVFYIHPTMFFASSSWNAPLDHTRANEGINELVIPAQTSVWNGCCRIYAPRYRQATVGVFLETTDSGRSALDLAYRDVVQAFDHYLEHWNDGRPFILASHSQGTNHGIRLLEDEIAGQPIQDQLIAAYLIGFQLPLEKLQTSLTNVPACETATDTGCLIAWDSFAEGVRPDLFPNPGELFFPEPHGGEWRRRASPNVCVNPLSWRHDTERVDADQNPGAVHIQLATPIDGPELFRGEEPLGLETTGLSAPRPNEVSARCGEGGFLYISEPKTDAFQRAVLPGKNYHNHDYGLFYMSLRKNAADRAAAFQNERLGSSSSFRD